MASSMGSRPSSQRGNTMGSSANSQRSGNAIRLSDVHESLHSSTSTCYIKPWGREIEGATGLTAEWHDQGWGNRKGLVFARTTGGTPYYGRWQLLSGNEAPHAITRLGVQLPSSLRRRRIQFGYRVGGGGGHEIHIEQAVVNVQGGTAPAPARPTGNAAARERPSYSAAFAVNQRVEVRWRGGNQWFTGKITAIRGDRLYDILYDDGESEARVAESLIRRWVSTPHTASARPTERARADAAEAEAKAAEERRQRLAAEAQAAEAERKLRAAEAAAADKKRREAAAAAEAERRRRAANEAINAFDNYGYTKLNWAAYKGDVRKTRELLQAGADPNIIAKGDRMTPLAHAAWAGHPEIAQILLNHPWMDVKKFGKHALRMANLPMDSGTRTWASDCNFGGLEGRKAVGDMIKERCPELINYEECCAVS